MRVFRDARVHARGLFVGRRRLVARLPLVGVHAIYERARIPLGQIDAVIAAGLAQPVAKTVAAETAPAHEVDVLDVGAVPQVLDQPAERRFGITRACLGVLAEFRNPVGIISKNALVTRDIDHLQELARHRAVNVCVSVTTLDPELGRKLEPRASTPAARLGAVRALHDAGIPVGINIAPVIPGLNDHEIPAILDAAAAAGAGNAGYGVVRLPHAVKDLFAAWLHEHVPTHAEKVMNRIAAAHGGGSLAGAAFFTRKTGSSALAAQLGQLFAVARRRAGLEQPWPELSTAAFLPPQGRQTTLFDG